MLPDRHPLADVRIRDVPEPARWTDDDHAAATSAQRDGRTPRTPLGDGTTGAAYATPWWQRAAARHPVTRFLLIFVPLAALWFGWKFHDVGTAPAAPAIQPAVTPAPAAADTAVVLPPPPVWQDPLDAHMSDEARRAALLAKEAAWRAWYQRPERCERPASADIEVECATHYLEHAREFEARYRAGTLPTTAQ